MGSTINVPPSPKLVTLTFLTHILFVVLLLIIKVPSTLAWCYDKSTCGPSTWGGVCSSGMLQSPINIPTSKVTRKTTQNTRLFLNRNYLLPKSYFLKNDGHTLQLYLNENGKSKCLLVGDGLGSKTPYYFSQLHFHWGPNNRIGSEHHISGKAYPLEMHMVHKLLKDPGRIAVLGVLFYLSPNDNPNLNPILAQAGKIIQPDTKVTGQGKVNLTALLPKKMRMFRYTGSLTTPPCNETVVWTVFRDPVPVSKRQMAKFRKLVDDTKSPITNNFRPVQKAFTNLRKSIFFVRQLKRSDDALIHEEIEQWVTFWEILWGTGTQQNSPESGGNVH